MIKVVKFGGSSLADAHQFKKVGKIIRKDVDRRYVVPAAPGKRSPDAVSYTHLSALAAPAGEGGQIYLRYLQGGRHAL